MGMEERPFRASGGWVMEYRQQIEQKIAEVLDEWVTDDYIEDLDTAPQRAAAAVFEALRLEQVGWTADWNDADDGFVFPYTTTNVRQPRTAGFDAPTFVLGLEENK